MKRGQILFLQKSGLYVVPFENKGDGYTCAVVKGNDIYQVGGYHIFVHSSEIDAAYQYEIEDNKLLLKINTTPMKVDWETEWDCVSKGCINKTDDPIFSLCDVHRK